MQDYSDMDNKYFVDRWTYNCPFCNRNNVRYTIEKVHEFDWTAEKKCYLTFTLCSFCGNVSMHSSFEKITSYSNGSHKFLDIIDIDEMIFNSQPTSFFVLDNRIPKIIRELITEAEGCVKMNFLTGASACMRKAIYELLVKENAEGSDYESRIKSLKRKYPTIEQAYFDIMAHIQDMTSEKIHEQSWDKWDSKRIKLIMESLKTILHEIYVEPKEKIKRLSFINKLKEEITISKKS